MVESSSLLDFSLLIHQVRIFFTSFQPFIDALKIKTCKKRLANTCFFACSLKRVRVTTKSPHLNVPSEDCRYFAQVVNKNVEDVTYCRLLPFNLYMSPPGVYLTVAVGELGSTLHMNLSAFSRIFCKALGSLS